MKILLAFDSFKGSLSSAQAGELLAETLSDFHTEVVSVADGGEGSLLVLPYPSRAFDAVDPWGEPIHAHYKTHLDTAYFELALTCGLTLITRKDPLYTHTEGLGLGIKQALAEGYKKIVIFAGGSATNDAGLGALYALGFRFFDAHGVDIRPRGGNLMRIMHYEKPSLPEGVSFSVATDVTNPFTGPQGATFTYGPQKGARPEDLPILEAGLLHLENSFAPFPLPPGAGAAGGLAGGFHLFLAAKIFPATDILLRDLREKVKNADIVISGEGNIDSQTLHGKLISKLLNLSTEKKFILIGGRIESPLNFPQILLQEALAEPQMSTPYAMKNAAQLLQNKGNKLREFLENYRRTHNINA